MVGIARTNGTLLPACAEHGRSFDARRFQRKEYAPIDIVLTEKKGFGLRAAENLPKCVYHTPRLNSSYKVPTVHGRDTFIYEYLGDVVSQPSFLKRMRLYAEEGIRHFYFMMLQKDEARYAFTARLHTPLTYVSVH